MLISATLEGACASLRDGSLVNTGYLLEHPKHVIYWHLIRDKDWHHLFQVYWDFESEYLAPTPAHVIYLVNRVLQAAQELTLAIRLKNDLIINDGKGPEAMINEIDVAKLIVNRFFHGHDIAPEEDVPLWAAVHCLTYYCAAQSIASRILHNREMQIAAGSPHISDADAAALRGTADRCAKGLPVLEAIKENGWNVLLAESVDPKGSYANHRESRLLCLREWASWVNNPYDEQRGASRVPEERRGKCYTFTNQGRDEFPTPPRARWPQWTIPGYLNYYEQKYGTGVNTAAAPQKVEPMSAPGASGTPNVQQAFVATSQGASAAAPSVPPWRDPTQYTVEHGSSRSQQEYHTRRKKKIGRRICLRRSKGLHVMQFPRWHMIPQRNPLGRKRSTPMKIGFSHRSKKASDTKDTVERPSHPPMEPGTSNFWLNLRFR